MKRSPSLVGLVYGSFTVLENYEYRLSGNKGTQLYYQCRCKCGNIKWVRASHLKKRSRSCGCTRRVQNRNNKKFTPTENQLDTIKYLYEETLMPASKIAELYETTKNTIIGIAYRKGWAKKGYVNITSTLFSRLAYLESTLSDCN